MSEAIDHAAICRIYADELLGEPAVSRCLLAGADEIERLTAEVHRLRLENAALIAKPNRGRLELGGGE